MSVESFLLESDMVAALLPRLRRLAGWRKGEFDVFFEVPAARGVPDVVVVEFKSSARDGYRSAVVEQTDVAAWVALSERAATGQVVTAAQDLATHLGLSVGHLGRAVLPRLLERDIVAPAGRGRWRLIVPYEAPISRLVTVELKTKDRFGALHQAVTHGQGADRAWVVLDATRLPAHGRAGDVARETYASRGIGLATLRRGRGALTVLSRPAPGGARSFSGFTRRAARAVLAERVLALHLAGLDAGPTWPVFGRVLPTGRPGGPSSHDHASATVADRATREPVQLCCLGQ